MFFFFMLPKLAEKCVLIGRCTYSTRISYKKTMEKLLKFDHHLDDQKKIPPEPPPDVLVQIDITLASTDNVPRAFQFLMH